LPPFLLSARCGECHVLPPVAAFYASRGGFLSRGVAGACRASSRATIHVQKLEHVLQPLMEVPFGFFDHSVGVCMAFEAARQLRAVEGRNAVLLFVSGRGSPKFASADRPRHARRRTAICLQFCAGLAARLQQSCNDRNS